MSEITLDINNDGKADQVFSISSESDAFTGNYLIAFTGSHKNVDAFRSYMRSHTLDVDHDPERLVWSRWGAVFLSYVNNDFSPRYMDTDLFYESKNVYILFTNRSTEAKWVGGIVEMMPNNQLSVICNDP